MDEAQALGRDVRHEEALAYRLDRLLVEAPFEALLAVQVHSVVVLGIRALVALVLLVVVLEERLHRKTERMALVRPGAPHERDIEHRTLLPPTL